MKQTLDRYTFWLLILAAIEATLLLLGNLLGGIIVGFPIHTNADGSIFYFIQDGGIIAFPIIYIVTDIIVELYGRHIADQIARITCLINLAGFGLCQIAIHLPVIPDTGSEIMAQALSLSARVLLASVISFFASQLANNWCFERIKARTGDRAFWLRSLGSSFFARIIDTILFNFLAFYGRGTTIILIQQIAWAFVVPTVLEAIINPLTKLCAKVIKKRIV